MAPYFLMMDVGGTGIKAGILDREGLLLGEMREFPSRAKEDKATIFSHFSSMIETMGETLREGKDVFAGIGMAFPGPFDYKRGVSLMRGLGKYDAIFGLPVRGEILKRLGRKELLEGREKCPFLFCHDVEAFALGECRFGDAGAMERVFYLCIGTGAGSAFTEMKKLKKQGRGIPENGWIYGTPFREGTIDDYLSARGLKRLAAGAGLGGADGKGLYELAKRGDERALGIWKAFGAYFPEALDGCLSAFRPDGLVLGGNISRSFPFFGEPLRQYCGENGIRLMLAPDTSLRTMEGLLVRFQEKEAVS